MMKKIRIHRYSRSFIYIFLGLAAVVLLAVCAMMLWIRSLNIDKLAVPLLAPTELIDRNGQTVSQISSSKIDPVTLHQIPLHLRQAIVAVEDRRFYDHTGVDGIGIVRALFRNVKEGGISQGGSTITQQLAKNMFLTHEQTYKRKLTEAAYALKIELVYNKDQILETYLNQIYFGEGQWGIQQAAKTYFGKSVEELTLPESALLAALPKAPSHYSPYKSEEKALDRRNLVLGIMLEEGYITDVEYKQASSEPVQVKPKSNGSQRGKYAYYIDHVIEEAIDRYGLSERQLLAGGLRIYTELDATVQAAMDTAYGNEALFPKSAPDQLIQSGAVILDPYTGGVRGIVGGRGEHVYRGFNYATQLKRQPGSTMKPLIVYAPALEKGYHASSRLYDGPLELNGYRPTDYDKQYRGEVTLREAVVRSWNIPAVWLLNEIGLQTGKSFVAKLGIPLTKGDNHLALALGGMEEGVSPLQMAQAYSVFPNLGVVMPAHTIAKITTVEGRALTEVKPLPAPAAVMSESGAFEMTGLLMAAVQEGTGKNAGLNRPTAGKTGTTQLPEGPPFNGIRDGAKDAWFVGYTPELVGAVWLGYDQTDAAHYLSTSGGYNPAIVFKEMMTLALKDVPVGSFKQPARQAIVPGPKDGKNSGNKGKSENNASNKNKEKKDNGKDKGRKKEKEDDD